MQLLLPKLRESTPSRIVFVASDAHTYIKEKPKWTDISKIQYGTGIGAAFVQYCHTKLANVQTCEYLVREIVKPDEQLWINAAHPGAVASDIGKKIPMASTFWGRYLLSFLNLFFYTPDDGALTQIYLAAHPDIVKKNIRGKYYVPMAKLQDATPIAKDIELQKELWDLSMEKISNFL